ncbi:helicase associated domain-containing protein [Carboxylicivirga linearis]|uniref:Helicase associated domain-containing protein n=1 Tax=Carboxylicivirga linearis TaxID=1628157 RepID=A0ABS5K1C5_9BACT|nr:helicase associated domain-containing protein [Carboxylicivirga linearis]
MVTTSKNHKSLANWVSIQRTHISKLSKERISLLNEIDFFKDNQQEIKR